MSLLKRLFGKKDTFNAKEWREKMSKGLDGVSKNVFCLAPTPTQTKFQIADTDVVIFRGEPSCGKTWAMRTKALLMALRYPGIRILIMCHDYCLLRDNYSDQFCANADKIGAYIKVADRFCFSNGSLIQLGICNKAHDATVYRGQEYNVVFIDDADKFSANDLQLLYLPLRSANDYPCRLYLAYRNTPEWINEFVANKNVTFVTAYMKDNPLIERFKLYPVN